MASVPLPSKRTKGSINLIVPLPPPVTGMTAVTEVVARNLSCRQSVRIFNLAGRQFPSKLKTRLFRAYRCALACVWSLIYPRAGEFAYLVANASNGLFLTLILAMLLKLKRCRLVLHHHVYSYINRSDWRMRLLDRLLGSSGYHVLLSGQMRDDFQRTYGSRAMALVLHNGFMVNQESRAGEAEVVPFAEPPRFRLGHLSNLSLDKGLDTVLEVFRELKQERSHVDLVIAGGTNDPVAMALLKQAKEDFPSDVTCLGPVYGESKSNFYRGINAFLFPSRYANEAQPLVIIESHQFGKPVIATDRGTIRSVVGIGGVVLTEADFVARSVAVLKGWIDAPQSYETACAASTAQARASMQEGADSLRIFLESVCEAGSDSLIQEKVIAR